MPIWEKILKLAEMGELSEAFGLVDASFEAEKAYRIHVLLGTGNFTDAKGLMKT